MTRRQRILLWVGGAAAMAISGSLAYDYFHRTRLWPAEIQRNLLGFELAGADAMIDREGGSSFGEGMFRWRYRVPASDPRLKKFCSAPPPPEGCRFTRNRRLGSGVDQSVEYGHGVLTIEEVWN